MSKSRTIIATESFNSRTPGGVRQLSSLVCPVPGVGFNSRTPGGVRRECMREYIERNWFQFTHPGRGATKEQQLTETKEAEFQFTHPGRGATSTGGGTLRSRRGFNSRTPGGVRRKVESKVDTKVEVSIHAPREGCDNGTHQTTSDAPGFNSRTPGGVRQNR